MSDTRRRAAAAAFVAQPLKRGQAWSSPPCGTRARWRENSRVKAAEKRGDERKPGARKY